MCGEDGHSGSQPSAKTAMLTKTRCVILRGGREKKKGNRRGGTKNRPKKGPHTHLGGKGANRPASGACSQGGVNRITRTIASKTKGPFHGPRHAGGENRRETFRCIRGRHSGERKVDII